jgi:hypothetical protein
MAEKVYATHKPGQSISWTFKDKVSDAVKSQSLFFTGGLLKTSDKEEQAYVENLPMFKDGTIWLVTAEDVLAEAVAKAAALRATADKAVKAAQEAEAIVAALKKKPEPAK